MARDHTDHVMLYQLGHGSPIEKRNWNIEKHGEIIHLNLELLGRTLGGELDGRPLWLAIVCRICHETRPARVHGFTYPCVRIWWRNPKYEGPIPLLRNAATELICSRLTGNAAIKEQVKTKFGPGDQGGFADFIKASLFPPWVDEADAGLRGQLAKIALDEVYWVEVMAALGMPDPEGY